MAHSSQRQGGQGGLGPKQKSHKQMILQRSSLQIFQMGMKNWIWSRFSEDGLGLKNCLFQEGLTNGGEDLGSLDFFLSEECGEVGEEPRSNIHW